MKIDLLKDFISVAKHKSFSKAAKELYLSQSGLSSHISTLEKDLGFELFDRANNRVMLTSAGSVFLEYAQSILFTYNEGVDKAFEASKAIPPLKMTSIPPISRYYKPVMSIEGHPFAFVDLEFGTPPYEALDQGLIDIGIMPDYSRLPEMQEEIVQQGIVYIPIASDECGICAMKTHPLARKAALSKADLQGQTILIHSGAHFDTWKEMVRVMIGADVQLNFRLNALESISNLSIVDLRDSLYVCSLLSIAEYFAPRDDVVIFDTMDGAPILAPMAVAYKQDNSHPGIKRFVEHVVNLCADDGRATVSISQAL